VKIRVNLWLLSNIKIVMSFFILSVFNEYKVQNKVPPVKSVLYGVASGGDE
jgi:hypothetical protein